MSAVHINKDNFRSQVLDSDKKVLLDFWAPWCAPCRMVSPIIDEVAQERPDVVVGKINVDEASDLAQQFRTYSIPTLVVVRGGQVVSSAVGVQPKGKLLAMLGI